MRDLANCEIRYKEKVEEVDSLDKLVKISKNVEMSLRERLAASEKRYSQAIFDLARAETHFKEFKDFLGVEWNEAFLIVAMYFAAIFFILVLTVTGAVVLTLYARITVRFVAALYRYMIAGCDVVIDSAVIAYERVFVAPVRNEYIEMETPLLPSVNNGRYNQEAYLPSSPYIPTTTYPKFQVKVYQKYGESWVYKGCGFWAGDYILTAAHMVETGQTYQLVNANDHCAFVEVNGNDFIYADAIDVAAIPVTKLGKQITPLAISKASLPKIANQKITVQVVARDMMSQGTLVEDNENMGGVIYEGSTAGGFSGAPYYLNKTAFAVHVGSTQRGVGYEINYVLMVIKQVERGYSAEDSDDIAYERAMEYVQKTGKRLQYQRNPFEPREVIVKMNGKYVTLDTDDPKFDWDKMLEGEVKSYAKYTPENFVDNESAPKNVQVAPPVWMEGRLPVRNRVTLTNAGRTVPEVQLMDSPVAPPRPSKVVVVAGRGSHKTAEVVQQRRSRSPTKRMTATSRAQVEPDTAGPALTSAQLSVALLTTLDSLKSLLEAQSRAT